MPHGRIDTPHIVATTEPFSPAKLCIINRRGAQPNSLRDRIMSDDDALRACDMIHGEGLCVVQLGL